MEKAVETLGRCGRFALVERVGAGGMGEIFRARAVGAGGRQVAVKRLLPEAASDETFRKMFIDEARVASRLGHPNIARLYEFGEHEGRYFLAMEWVDGASVYEILRTLRESGRQLPVALAAEIALDCAHALDYAHTQHAADGTPLELVHRDVSPANIMVSSRGEVKLLDFGLAKANSQLVKTQPGFVKGKFGYLAPEQIDGSVDARTDVFALGICLYEMLTGKKLFEAPSPAKTIRAIQAFKEPPSITAQRRSVPDELEAVVRRCLAPDPEQRFESAAMAANALRAVKLSDVTASISGDATLSQMVQELFPDRRPATQPVPILRDEIAPRPAPDPEAERVKNLAAAGLGLVALVAMFLLLFG